MYRKDTTIPSHGRRAKADNAGFVRVKISRWPGYIFTGGDGFDFYLNIHPATETYKRLSKAWRAVRATGCPFQRISLRMPLNGWSGSQ